MNDFNKVYTKEDLDKSKMITMLSLPMEESIMVPIAQAIDLMKRGENVLYFSFNHDSIKVNEFLNKSLANEPNPSNIKGSIAIFDAHQMPANTDWISFLENSIKDVKVECELNYVFFDLLPFVENNPIRPGNEELVASTVSLLSWTQDITSIVIKTIDMPEINLTDKEKVEEFINKDLSDSLSQAIAMFEQSDLVIGIQREKETFWKKLINFLAFWRKKNNFTLNVLKNRNGKDKTYRMNLNLDTFETEVL